MWVLLYFFATRSHLCIFFVLPSTTSILLSSFWQVQVPYTKSQFQRFRCPWAVQIHFHSYFFSSPPQIFKCSSSFTLFLSASLSLVPFFTSVLYPPNFSIDTSISSWFPPISFHTSRLRYPTFFQLALSLLCSIQPYQLWLAASFLACSFPHIDISTFSRRLVLSGYILSSALQTVFLVVLEHPSTFLAAVVCTCLLYTSPSPRD